MQKSEYHPCCLQGKNKYNFFPSRVASMPYCCKLSQVLVIVIHIHSEIHNVVALSKCLLVLRCQLYVFRTIMVHPQEFLCSNCMCRLWYVLIRPAGTTFEEVLPQMLYQLDVSGSVFLTTYHNLHIQYLQRSS